MTSFNQARSDKSGFPFHWRPHATKQSTIRGMFWEFEIEKQEDDLCANFFFITVLQANKKLNRMPWPANFSH